MPVEVRIHNPNLPTGAYVQVEGEVRHLPMSQETVPQGEIMYQLNKTKDGWLVLLVNNRGVDKTQHGVARVDRTAFVDFVLRTKLPVKAAREYTQPLDLTVEAKGDERLIRVCVHPGDVQVIGLVTP